MPDFQPHSTRQQRTQWVSLTGFLVLLLIVNGTLGWLGVRYASLAHERGLASIHAIATAENTLRMAQVEFKVQVQEWKNILLRGHDPQDFSQFRQAFEEREQAVQQHLHSLLLAAEPLGVPAAEIEALRQGHVRLAEAYRAALSQFPLTDSSAHRAADAAVRGEDRALDYALDSLADQARLHGALVTHDLQMAAEQRARRLEFLTIIGTVLTVALLLIVVFMASRRA